jgi:hypothetical protein
MFVMELVIDLQDVKAERDDVNRPFNSYVLLVLHVQLVKPCTNVFI